MTDFIVLGGAGDMGSNVVRYLLKILNNNDDRITIGDYRVDIAKKVASEIDPKINYINIDANNHNELVKLFKEYDILINCVGPNFLYAVKVAKAAIEAGINGVDICDDFEPTKELLELGKKINDNIDITYIYGLGWTPGLTNICAKRGVELLDSCNRIHIGWTGDPNSEGLAVTEHLLNIMTGKVPTYQNGQWIDVPAGKRRSKYSFPEPIGNVKVFDLGHPEPVTIPYYISGLEEVTLKGALVPKWVNGLIKYFCIKFRRTNTSEKIRKRAIWLQKLAHKKLINKIINKNVLSTFRVEICGEKRNQPVKIIFSSIGNMFELTSLPAAIGAVMLKKNQISNVGLLPPEACVPADIFIEMVNKLGNQIQIEWIYNN